MSSNSLKQKTYLLLMLALLGCAKQNEDTSNIFSDKKIIEVSFPKTYNDYGTEIGVDMYGATDISIIDSLLIVSTPQLDRLYRIVSIDSRKTLAQIARKGRAASELTDAFTPMYDVVKNGEILVAIHDYTDNAVKQINLTQSIKDGLAHIDTALTLDMKLFPGLYVMHKLDDSIFFVDYMDIEVFSQKYAFFNARTKATENLPLMIDGSGLENIVNCYYLAGATAINIDRRGYVCAMKFVDQINILNILNPDSSFSVSTVTSRLGFAQLLKKSNRTYYYLDVVCSDDYIVGLYVGADNSNSTLYIFNWRGGAVCNIELGRPIERIELDTRTNTVYGITLDEQLFKYELNPYFALD